MYFKKKAQVDIQFNWIYIIIVGAIFIGFFFSVISSQNKSAELEVSTTLVNHFETILSSTAQQDNTLKVHEKISPRIKLNFVCSLEESQSYFTVQNSPPIDTLFDIQFSKNTVKGKDMITWTSTWKQPFRIASFLYISNKDDMFLFYDNTGSAKELYDNFPTNFTTKVLGASDPFESDESNYDHYTYVIVENEGDYDELYDIETFGKTHWDSSSKSSLVVIRPALTNNLFKYGTVSFCKNRFPADDCISQPYIGEASLYGAIFSSDFDTYKCNMNKAFQILRLHSLLNYNRIKNLRSVLPESCKILYGINIDDVESGPYANFNTLADLSQEFTETNVNEIVGITQTIAQRNNELALQSQCPTIY